MPDSPYNNSPYTANGPEPPARMDTAQNGGFDAGQTQQFPTSQVAGGQADSAGAGYSSPAPAPGSYRGDQAATAAQPAAQATYEQPTQRMDPISYKPAHTKAAAPAKASGGGKSFLMGLLGGVVACAVAFGGYTLAQGFANGGSAGDAGAAKESTSLSQEESQSGIALGSQTPTVVDENEGRTTLAEAVAAKVTPSVCCIYVYSSQQSYYGFMGAAQSSDSGELTESSLGSGIILTEDGYILTNYHVIEGGDALKVNIEGTEYDAEVVGTDPSSDLAVIKAKDASGLTVADIGNSDDLTVGEWVMSVGSPFGLESSVATGVVSATSRSRIVENETNYDYMFGYGQQASEPTLYPNMIQTDAAINPGNSGGALVDADGKVIGVNTLIASYSGNYSGVGFAIPVNYAINIADQIIAGKTPTHAKLGVSLTTVNSSVAKRYNLATDSGAYITDVSADSGADQAGLKVGDIVTAFDGEAVANATDLTLDIREHNPGDTVKITVNRNGETIEVDATLGSDENELASAAQQQEEQQQDPSQEIDPRDLSYEELLELLGRL